MIGGMEMLSTAQVAERLGVNPSRVRQLIISGKLKATRLSERVIIIEEADLDAYCRSPVSQGAGRKRNYTKHTKTDSDMVR